MSEEKEITRNVGVGVFVPDDRTLDALIRTHVCHNLLVLHWSRCLRAILHDDKNDTPEHRALVGLIEECLQEKDPKKKSRNLGLVLLTDDSEASALRFLQGDRTPEDALSMLQRVKRDRHEIRKKEVWSVFYGGGRSPGWVEKDRTEGEGRSGIQPKENWDKNAEKLFVKWCGEKEEMLTTLMGNSNPIGILHKAGWLAGRHILQADRILPIRVVRNDAFSEFARNAFGTAVTSIAVNRTKDTQRRTERAERNAEIEDLRARIPANDAWAFLCFEAASNAVFARDDNPGTYAFGRNASETRDWKRIRGKWLVERWRTGGTTPEKLRDVRINVQKRRKENQGDARVYEWLARPEQWFLWDGREAPDPEDRCADIYDSVSRHARIGRLTRPLSGIGWTPGDPIAHPTWAAFRVGNDHTNALKIKEGGFVPFDRMPDPTKDNPYVRETRGRCAVLPLLERTGDGFSLKDLRVGLGRSNRLDQDKDGLPVLRGPLGHIQVRYGAMSLQLDRAALDTLTSNTAIRDLLATGGPWSTEDVETIVSTIRDARPAVRLGIALRIPRGKTPKKLQPLLFKKKDDTAAEEETEADIADIADALDGERVLGVDLGTRTAAALSVVAFSKNGRGGRRIGPIAGRIVHTDKVVLDGEEDPEAAWEAQAPLHATIRYVRGLLEINKKLVRRIVRTDTGEDGEKEEIAEAIDAIGRLPTPLDTARSLCETAEKALADAFLPGCCRAIDRLLVHCVDRLRAIMGERRKDKGGLSTARIDALTAAVRTLRAFSGRRRLMPDERVLNDGTPRGFGRGFTRMNTVIRNKKKDRCRKIAAGIVHAALRQRCSVIALENLSRYKFHGDRPKSENRRLQLWCHGQIIGMVRDIAAVHGVLVRRLPAGYSSRFAAIDRAPGLRAGPLRQWTLDQEWWTDTIKADKRLAYAKVGDLVPLGDGESLLVVRDGKQYVMNADTNAAAEIAFRLLAPPKRDPVYLRLERDKDAEDKNVYVVMTYGDMCGLRMRLNDDKTLSHADATTEITRKGRNGDRSKDEETDSATRIIRAHRDNTRAIRGGAWVEASTFWAIARARVIKTLQFPDMTIPDADEQEPVYE